ncbi:MAG: hypothetical protein H0T89_11395 [Deltaproteobacteria bacterium]|nr:hypothetical protein [Deltaproteobacteria bacterium]MDQ3299083.1 hypothetical protein [Myxococcota bacterium]
MRNLFALIATVGLVGCVGDVTDMPTPEPEQEEPPSQDTTNPAGGDLTAAKKLFNDNVFAILTAKCTGGACHSETATGSTLTRFVATDAVRGWEVATGYQALVGTFTSGAAPVLTIIKPGNHKGVTYAPADEQKIVAWLDAEVAARNGQPTTPPPAQSETLSQATERVLSAFAGCMTIDNFKAANMAQAWGGLEAEGNTECDNCHNSGAEGFMASRQANFMYDVISTKKYYFLQYLTVDLTQGPAAAKVVVNKASFLGVSNAQDPHREHPRFNANTNPGMTALNKFYTDTMARVNTPGLCAPRPLANQ